MTLYALADSGDTRRLGAFDAAPDPGVQELVADFEAGEALRPDFARLPRLRPGFDGNPLADQERGVPGAAINWIEVEGPLHGEQGDAWPPPPYVAVFGDLPFTAENGRVTAESDAPDEDAARLVADFARRAARGAEPSADDLERYLGIYRAARVLGDDFTDATLAAYSAVLCSPEALFLTPPPGPLAPEDLADRLALFLWDGPPDAALLEHADALADADGVKEVADEMLDDPRSDRFLTTFLDHWLDLRAVHDTAPDATLYPDYFLDSLLTESAVAETRATVRHLIDADRPARELVDADYAFLNERLAEHYGLPPPPGPPSVELERVDLPADSVRGGLLTQAAVLKVTANGTTTSPVLRGVWAVERLLGEEIADPPSGVEAIEPDLRGAVTVRDQLVQHKQVASCAACHEKFDPVGFALESFDVMGGSRTRYRATGGGDGGGDGGEPVAGFGKNGLPFAFRLARPVESDGRLRDGRRFESVRDLKRLLLTDERRIARNFVHRLATYATGAPASFGDRAAVEAILTACEPDYGVRDLILETAASPLVRER